MIDFCYQLGEQNPDREELKSAVKCSKCEKDFATGKVRLTSEKCICNACGKVITFDTLYMWSNNH